MHCADLPKICWDLRTKLDADWLFPSSEAGKDKPHNTCQQKLCCIFAVGNLLSGIRQTIFWKVCITSQNPGRYAQPCKQRNKKWVWYTGWKALFWIQAGPVATDFHWKLLRSDLPLIEEIPPTPQHPSAPISCNFSKGLLFGRFFMPRLGTHRRWCTLKEVSFHVQLVMSDHKWWIHCLVK